MLSVDEKSQIQALDRTQPVLPLREWLPERQTHDYRRHGTTTLFAALNVLEGTVIAQCRPRHCHQEFLRFLNRIDRSVPEGRAIHLILDNYGTHKHAQVREWLRRPRYHLHFTPTGSSWLNQIERWFAEITRKRIRRGTFHSVRELTTAIDDYIRTYDQDPRPFQWVASDSRIIRKLRKYNNSETRRLVGCPGDSVTIQRFHTPGPIWEAMEVAATNGNRAQELTRWFRSRTLAARDVIVASLILALADGKAIRRSRKNSIPRGRRSRAGRRGSRRAAWRDSKRSTRAASPGR